VLLEKASAPFEDQLQEAAKFIALDPEDIGKSNNDEEHVNKKSKTSVLYAKEEWLLKWLLKKLQAPKDDIPR
jgi:nucleolar pre-ribosomal-associated protein 2